MDASAWTEAEWTRLTPRARWRIIAPGTLNLDGDSSPSRFLWIVRSRGSGNPSWSGFADSFNEAVRQAIECEARELGAGDAFTSG